jgi:hypothetical protein
MMATDWPAWNYWMWDDKGEYIYKYDHAMEDHPDAEFLWQTDYDDKWMRKLFWSPEQATALSFGRSPDKVTWDDEPFGVKDMEGSSEFASHFCMLRDEIIEAQNKGLLPSSIPALMYVEWAETNNVPFPPSLASSVGAFHKQITDDAERFVRLEELVQRQGEELKKFQQELLVEGQLRKVTAEAHPRLRSNLLKVILAVAKQKYGHPKAGAAKKIVDTLLLQGVSLSEDTLLSYLRQAEEID